MRNYFIGVLHSENGIQRDGTSYASKAYIDGQWMRIWEGTPQKIGGCQLITYGGDNIIRSLFSVPISTTASSNGILLYMGQNPSTSSALSIQYLSLDIDGSSGAIIDRTPADLPITTNTIWNFASANLPYAPAPYSNALSNLIFAQQSVNYLTSTVEGPIFVGGITTPAGSLDNTPLVQVYDTNHDPVVASGGILFCAPAMIAFGKDGTMTWTPVTTSDPSYIFNPGSPTTAGTWDTTNNRLTIAGTKLVYAANARGGGTAPTILVWALDSLNRCSLNYTPSGTLTFENTTVQDKLSIISARSVVNYDQQFFWIGTDQFYVYNGIVQTLKNTRNSDWFFQNVNRDQASKIFGVAVPQYREIWWYYPRGTSTECNAVIIYNVELNEWYDNTIDPDAPFAFYPFTRAAGIRASAAYPYPILSDNTLVANPLSPHDPQTYPIWTHEIGVDRVINTSVFPINSYYSTHRIDLWTTNGANTNLLNSFRIAPDFDQTGSMTVSVNNWLYPNSQSTTQGPFNFTNSTEFVDFSSQGGSVSFTFASNEVGGSYHTGKPLYFYEKGDVLK